MGKRPLTSSPENTGDEEGEDIGTTLFEQVGKKKYKKKI